MTAPAALGAQEENRGPWPPERLAHLLGQPAPTAEQAAVISAPLAPGVIVAGAGSGKSETMASRVVWLVANGHVRPEQVLGLTFTRKAAVELADRVRNRLDTLREAQALPAEAVDGDPAVSTYHSYAARLVGDHALREAVEPSVRLITDAVAWQLASRVVGTYDGPMDAVTSAPAGVVGQVLELAGELSEHLRRPDDVREIGAWLRDRAEKPPGRPAAAAAKALTTQAKREQLLPLVEQYAAAKAAREVIDYGDQVALAARIARRHPEVGLIERDRYRVVLLDEYQDTSHAQLVLLRALFGEGHPVTAVGDPCQSIYGWRGASSGNLLRFPTDFPERPGRPAPVRKLATSFRNGERILEAARTVSEPLRAEAEHVPVLRPGPARTSRGALTCALLPTEEQEAEWVAEQIGLALENPRRTAPDGQDWPDGEGPPDGRLHPGDVAVLCRKRAQFPPLRAALERRGIAVEVVGLGGLLTVPEVRDIVAVLRVLHDPTAGAELVRLLTGPHCRLGPRDLVALGARATELAEHTHRDLEHGHPAGQESAADPLRQTVLDLTAENGSLVDALDDPGPEENYSPSGHTRILGLGERLRALRRLATQPLPELIGEVERALDLDIEVAARPRHDPVAARADLDAFIDAAVRFSGNTEDPTLGTFLAYLASAEDTEHGLESGRVGSSDSVKLMTVHGAKGLQWSLVAVPGLSGGSASPVFPARPRRSGSWLKNERKIPFALRGDRGDLPELTGLDRASLAAFEEANREREQMEERRLAYVALTRASYALLCSGHWWGAAAASRRGPSVFLEEVHAVCAAGGGRVAHWAPPPDEDETNPALADEDPVNWPPPPDGRVGEAGASHADSVDAARLVERARSGEGRRWMDLLERAELPAGMQRRLDGWNRDVELLLAHRATAAAPGGPRGEVPVELPQHLTVSSLVSLARDPAELARRIRRPLPRPPAPHTRRGTAFHTWLESRFTWQQDLLGPDELPGAADETAVDTDLAELQRRFEDSEWSTRTPAGIEVPFETIIGDRLVRGRMDAVFADAPEGGYDVVDWKTGRPPSTARERRAVAVQLAAYRLAWAELAGVPPERVRAAFHYVRTGETVRPADLPGTEGLAALLEEVPEGE